MFEQEYIMRLIHEIARTFAKLVFNVDSKSPAIELLEDKEEKKITEELLEMIDAGEINEAENKLYDLFSQSNVNSLEVALVFYSYLNDKPDDFLEENAFSRDEIKLGLENAADEFGLGSIARVFSTD